MAELRDQLQKTLGGTYAFDRELGGGGMSRVFVAEETALGRKVVIKVLPPDLAATVNVERFRREIQLAAQLLHPHIVPLLSAGIADGLPYYTMPFIEGDSLRTRIIRQGELPINDALRILRDMTTALSYAHEHGVVHRDIKPENVMLTKHHALIMDFGVAKALSAATNPGNSLTSMGVALGTPAYMSPEQATADPHTDHRADIYALGAVAYEMLTGRQLFGDRSPQAMLRAHAVEKPDPIETRRATVPPALAALVMRMLEKSPADRPQTADDLLRTLDTFVVTPSGMTPTGTVPVQTIQTPVAAPAAKSPRRSRSLIAAALVGAGILAAGGMVAKGKLSGPALDPARVIVLPFANRTGDPQYDELGELAADWVVRGLTEADIADVVSIESLSSADDSASGAMDPRAMARAVGAGRIVQGDIHLRGDLLEFRVSIIETRDGSRAGNVQPSSSPRTSPMAAIDGMRQRTMGAMATLTKKSVSGLALPDVPPSYDAYQEFMRGEESFQALEMGKAAEHYIRAATLDSSYATPVVRAVYAYLNLGQPAKADSLATELTASTRKISEYERRYLDRAVAQIEGDWQAAYSAAQQLKAAAPSSSFAQYIAARAAIPVNRLEEAARELEKLWPNKFPESAYFLDLANVYHLLGNYKRQERVLRKAQEVVPGHTRMLDNWARMYAATGKLDEVSRVLQEIRANHNPPAVSASASMQGVAAELEHHGHPAKAREVRESLVSWINRRPATEVTPTLLGIKSYALARLGRCPEANRLADSVYSARQTVGSVGNRGIVAAHCDRQVVADSMVRALVAMKEPYLRGNHLLQLARIAAIQGKKAEAVDLLVDAVAQGTQAGGPSHNVAEFATLRGYAPYESAIRPKQ